MEAKLPQITSEEIVEGGNNDARYQEETLESHLKTKERVQVAVDREHKMTFLEAVRKYPAAIFWSLGLATCIIMVSLIVLLVIF
jgi:hypothetical protein